MWVLLTMAARAAPADSAPPAAPALAEAMPAPRLGVEARLVLPELPRPRLVLMPRPGLRRVEPGPAWSGSVVLAPAAEDFALELLSGVVTAAARSWAEDREFRRRPLGEALPPLR